MPSIPFNDALPRFADVSHWQPVQDFALYADSVGGRALGFKINQGTKVDFTAHAHLAGAKAHGLVAIGFSYGAGSVETFLAEFPPAPGRIPVLDFEGDITVGAAEAWVAAVHAAYGRYPWFYGRSVWNDRGAPKGTLIEKCPYWGPQYGPRLDVPEGVGTPIAFQYTDGKDGPEPHSVPGIGACDLNMLLCSPAELRMLAGL